jgi:hypothetical protein
MKGFFSAAISSLVQQAAPHSSKKQSRKNVAAAKHYAWDAQDHCSGVYFYKLQVGKYSKMMKMVLVK